MDPVSAALAAHPFARRLSGPLLDELRACARAVRFEPGAAIFREGTPAAELFLLCRGRVALNQHVPGRGPLQVEELRQGDILGLSWLFPEARWTLDARAMEEVEAIALEGGCVRSVMQREGGPALPLALHMIERLYERLLRVRLQRLDVYRKES